MIRIRNIKVDVKTNNLREMISKKIKTDNFTIQKILHKSIDARNKSNVFYVYDVLVNTNEKIRFNEDILEPNFINNEIKVTGNKILSKPIIIIGFGPAGMFASYILSSLGYKVIVFERGKQVEEREKDVKEFWLNNKLNSNSNVLFGEGGAGTFSDGKLMTSIKDKEGLISKVLEIFYDNGADEKILYENHPHIGTDKLTGIVKNMREKIILNGGEIHFESILTNILIKDNKITGVVINNKDIYETDNLIIAIGHGAKDTFNMLYEKGVLMENKPFAVGIRIMHDQNMINENQYGKYKDFLPPAEYKLTYQASTNRGVYSFCMCPGGFVVNSSSEHGYLSINGMSYSKRDSNISNSAIIVTVNNKDFGEGPLDGIKYQENLEKKAYSLGNGKILVQTFKDYKSNVYNPKDLLNLKIKGNYTYANINEVFPDYINTSLKEAITYFGKKIKGFDDDNVIIAAVESKTSSPVKFIRNENMESNIKGLYPIGEGSGYAGGITTSAIEGIKIAKIITSIYKRNSKIFIL